MKTQRLFIMAVAITGLFLISSTFSSTLKADDIIGEWYTDGNKSAVWIYKNKSGIYFGKIVWLKDPNESDGKPKVDKENPDPKLRTTPLIGLVILKSFKFDSDKWTNGTIYDPENGKTYKCTIRMQDINTIDVRGYIGVSAIGRTTTWKRKTS